MALNLKLRKSAGVRVSPSVHHQLTLANRARDARAWKEAADAYDAALKLDPGLSHIWIQMGHALKEADDLTGAEAAYRQALALRPDLADAHLHLGHVKKRQGDATVAGRFYVAAAKLDPHNADAIGEVRQMLGRGSGIATEALQALLTPQDAASALEPLLDDGVEQPGPRLSDLIETLRQQGAEIGTEAATKLNAAVALLEQVEADATERMPRLPQTHSPLVFDVSDLVAYFKDGRLPTGIQRVQIEILSRALQA